MQNISDLEIDNRTLPAGSGPVALMAVLFLFLFVQLSLGTDIIVVVLCAFTLLVTMTPLFIYGRDIYTVLSMIFGLRYTGVSLLMKTIYGQSLGENLNDPETAFGLSLVILTLYVLVILVARKMDHQRYHRAFPPLPAKYLHWLGIICLLVGGFSDLVVGLTKASITEEAAGGAVYVLSSAFSNVFYAGIAAEVMYAVHKTNRETFVTPTLIIGLSSIVSLSALTNTREFFTSCIVTTFVSAFLYGAVRRRHLVLGAVVVAFFVAFISPVTLFIRVNKEGLSKGELASFAANTMVRALSDSDFYSRLLMVQSMVGLREDGGVAEYDYYGNNSNVLNRLSYVALIDHIYDGVKNRPDIGWKALEEEGSRLLPGFIFKKEKMNYGFSDYLAWQVAVEDASGRSFINFSLPMEGLAIFGNISFLFYTITFPLLTFWLCQFFTSLRNKSVVGITLFSCFQHLLVEATSDMYIAAFTRMLPIVILTMGIIYKVVTPKVGPSFSARLSTSTEI